MRSIAFTILLGAVTASSYLSCGGNSPGKVIPPSISGRELQVEVHSSILDNTSSRNRIPPILPESRPGFRDCLTTLPEPHYSLEQGLRLKICSRRKEKGSPDPWKKRLQELKESWHSLDGSSRMRGPVGTSTYHAFLKELMRQRILFFFDGNGRKALSQLAPLHEQARRSMLASRFIQDDHRDELLDRHPGLQLSARRFPALTMSFLLLEGRLLLIYPSQYRQRLHTISISLNGPQQVSLRKKLYSMHNRMHKAKESLHSSKISRFSPAADIQECYDRKQIEIRCSGPTRFAIRTDDHTIEQDLLCGQRSLLLLHREPDGRIQWMEDYNQEPEEDGSGKRSRVDIPYVHEERSLQWHPAPNLPENQDTKHNGYWSAMPCNPYCHSLGYPNSHRKPDLPICKPEDLQLTEINPAGILKTNDALDPGGKFLEFQTRGACRTAGMQLLLDGETLLLPWEGITSHRILITADTSYFTDSDDVQRLEDHRIRYLGQDSILEILQPALQKRVTVYNGRDSGSDSQSDSQRESLNPIRITGRRRSSGTVRAIHSLQITGTPPLFHPSTCRGLLPDLCASHGMSPGFSARGARAPKIALDEILPAGLVGSPELEFLEWRTRENQRDREKHRYISGSFRIHLTSSRHNYQFDLPVPMNRNGRFALMRRKEGCFSDRSAVFENSEFRIPNETFRMKAELVLETSDGRTKTTLIDRMFRARFQDRSRSHLKGRFQRWMKHAGSRPCLSASPGGPGKYRPALQVSGMNSLELIWHADEPARARIIYPDLPDSTGKDVRIWLNPGSNPFKPNLQGGRKPHLPVELQLLEVFPSSAPLQAGGPNGNAGLPERQRWYFAHWKEPASSQHPACYFESISASNPEWVRICFPYGNAVHGATHFSIEDEYSSDPLVSASERKPWSDPEARMATVDPEHCVLLLDPDITLEYARSMDDDRDQQWWLPESGAALGNGIRTDESLIFRTSHGDTLCTFRRGVAAYPETQNIVRRHPGTLQDIPENFYHEVAP